MKTCYALFTAVEGRTKLLTIYKKSSYEKACQCLVDISERDPDRNIPIPGNGKIVMQVVSVAESQRWWLERWEVK